MLKINAKKLGTVAVVCAEGQIVNGETEALRNAVDSLVEMRAVILDLARVTRVDAHGLGVMLELRERTHTRGARFELMNVNKPIRSVLEITRLDSVFRITSGIEFFPPVSRERRTRVAALRTCA